MKKKLLSIIVVIIGILIAGQIYFTYFYVYQGKVIDADTKAPIDGAVVVASWREERPTPAGPTSRLKDVRETLTDKNGEWFIRGARGERLGPSTLLSYVTSFFTGFMWGTYTTERPEFIVFKPGYCSWPAGLGIDACREKMKTYDPNHSNNIGGVVELPKLTDREDRERNLPGTEGFSREFDKKQLNFLRLINEEHNNLYGEKTYENYIRELESEK